MAKLTKAKFAASKKALGLKGKLTRKQVQRVFKHAIKKLGRKPSSKSRSTKTKTTRKTTRKTKSNPKGGKNRMGRKGKNISQSIFKIARMVAIVGPGVAAALPPERPAVRAARVIRLYTGYDTWHRKWRPEFLVQGYGPYLATSAITHLIPKINGLIRRLF